MAKARMRILTALAAVTAVMGSLAMYIPSAAQEGTSSGLQISPTRTEVLVNAGEVKTFKLSLKNVTSAPVVAKGFVNDFNSDNDSGTPKIIVDATERAPRSIIGFVKTLNDVPLEPNQTTEVEITVEVPVNTAPGGYYGVIRYAAIPQSGVTTDEERQLVLTASVANIVLIQVPGDITESLRVDGIDILKNNKASSIFFTTPDKVGVVVTNTGNSFLQPFGRISVEKWGKEIHSYEVNSTEPRGNVLPDTRRRFIDELKNVKGFGQYKVIANVSYVQGGEVITATKTFWVIPIWLIAIVVALITALVVGLVVVAMKRRS